MQETRTGDCADCFVLLKVIAFFGRLVFCTWQHMQQSKQHQLGCDHQIANSSMNQCIGYGPCHRRQMTYKKWRVEAILLSLTLQLCALRSDVQLCTYRNSSRSAEQVISFELFFNHTVKSTRQGADNGIVLALRCRVCSTWQAPHSSGGYFNTLFKLITMCASYRVNKMWAHMSTLCTSIHSAPYLT